MKISDLVAEKDSSKLSKSAIMLWITFLIAIVFWIVAIIRGDSSMRLPDGLFNLLIALLTYHWARRGSDSVASILSVLKREDKANHDK